MSIFDDDDLDYINAQFSTLATSMDYPSQEQQDPWRSSLAPDSILRNVDLPSIYNDYYAMLSNDTHPPGITVSALKHILDSASQDSIVPEKILSLVSPDCLSQQTDLSRAQYDLSLALLACAQHGLGLSLESVYRNRSDLPIPELPSISLLSTTTATKALPPSSPSSPSSATVSMRSVVENMTLSPSISSGTLSRPSISSPTLCTSTSKQQQQQQHRRPEIIYGNDDDDDDDNFSGIGSASDNYTIDDRGCDQQSNSIDIDKTKSDPVKGYQWYLDMDLITVSLMPQKEGRLFKHVNYLVASQHGTISVTRRFNEFYRLWESLLKRYPLRSVPDLPPKKIKANEVFLEKRRRGLARFMNALERHPVLAKDELVHAFLSYQDLQQWWKDHQPSMDDEFIRTMPDIDSLRSNIPHDMTDRLKRLQRRITPAIERYDDMITAIQQLISNEQGEADDLIRYSITLSAMDEEEQQAEHQSICTPCQQSLQGYEKVAQSMQAMARLLDDKALSLTNTFTEHLHYHRHLFASFGDMLDRKDHLLETITDKQHTIPRSVAAQIISAHRRPLSSPQLSPTLAYQHQRQLSNEQLDIILQRDHIRESLHQHRMLYIHSCLASELTYLHKQQAFISLMYQDLVRQQHKYASEQHQRWKSLQVELDALVSHDPDHFD